MYHKSTGRPSIPPSILAQVLLLPEREYLSDIEADHRIRFEKPEIDWADADARAERLTQIGRDSRHLLKELDGTRLLNSHIREAAALTY